MNFFEPGLPGDRGSCMFVQSPPMSTEFELFVNIDRLISEDFSQV